MKKRKNRFLRRGENIGCAESKKEGEKKNCMGFECQKSATFLSIK